MEAIPASKDIESVVYPMPDALPEFASVSLGGGVAIDPIPSSEEEVAAEKPTGVAEADAFAGIDVAHEASTSGAGTIPGRKSPFSSVTSSVMGVVSSVAYKVQETGRAIASVPVIHKATAQATSVLAPIAARVAEGASTMAAAAQPSIRVAQTVAINAAQGVSSAVHGVATNAAAGAQRLLNRGGGAEDTSQSHNATALDASGLPPAAGAPEAADFSIEEDAGDGGGALPTSVSPPLVPAADEGEEAAHITMTTAERLAALQMKASVAANAIGGRVSAAASEVASRVRETGGAIAALPAVQQVTATASEKLKQASAAASKIRREVAATPAMQHASSAVNNVAGRAVDLFGKISDAAKKVAMPPFGAVGQAASVTATTSASTGAAATAAAHLNDEREGAEVESTVATA
jgi:hypothetical protein